MNTVSEAELLRACRLGRILSHRYPAPGFGIDAEDLESEAALGVLNAARPFDPKRGVKFASFGGQGAKHFVIRRLQRERRQYRVPARQVVSFDQPLSGSEGVFLADVLEDPRPGPEALGAGDLAPDFRKALAFALRSLPERHQAVLALRFGEQLTCREVGARLGLSHETVRKAEHAALRTLRARLRDWQE